MEKEQDSKNFDLDIFRDILSILKEQIQEVKTITHEQDNQGHLRIALSDYIKAREKIQREIAKSYSIDFQTKDREELDALINEFEDTTTSFEETWSDEMKEISRQQEKPELVMEQNERTSVRLNKLNKTIQALTTERDRSSFDLKYSTGHYSSGVLKTIDNENPRGGETRSFTKILEGKEKKECCCLIF